MLKKCIRYKVTFYIQGLDMTATDKYRQDAWEKQAVQSLEWSIPLRQCRAKTLSRHEKR